MVNRRALIVVVMLLILQVVAPLWVEPVAASTDSPLVVALGDSYTAGNGALDYEDRDCYRSANAYSEVYGRSIGASTVNLACSDDVISDVYLQIKRNKSVVESANIVVMTIGGNDFSFTSIVRKCLSVERILHHQSDCRQLLEDTRLSREGVVGRTRDLLTYVRSLNKDAEIVLVGYPYLMARECVFVGESDAVHTLQTAFESFSEAMVSGINDSAISFVSVQDAFAGGAVCEGGPQLIRGSFDTLPTPNNIREWWHPNKEGHQRIAETIFAAGIHNRLPDPIDSGGGSGSSPTPPPPTTSEPGEYTAMPFACGVEVPYISTYGQLTHSGGVSSHGYAIDIPLPDGAEVVAPASGEIYVGTDPAGYGTYIDLVDGRNIIHRMAHMQPGVLVATGDQVQKGETLGYVGTTGLSTGPHIHYENRTVLLGQIPIAVDGVMVWGESQNLGGFRTTTHSVVSGNCSSAGGAFVPSQSATHQATYDDTRNRLWFLGVKESGTMFSQYYSDTTGNWSSFTQHGTSGGWSSESTPAMTIDTQDRVWVAHVKSNGTAYARHLSSSGWSSWTQIGSAGMWSTEAGLVLAPRSNGNVTLAGVTSGGTLMHSTGNPNNWTGPVSHGIADTWSTTGPPGLTVDTAGNLWLGAIKQNGNLYIKSLVGGSWSSFVQQGSAGSWAPDAGLVLTPRGNGNISFAAIGSGGSLHHATGNPNNWTGLTTHGVVDSWSTTGTPALVEDAAGVFWIGGIKQNGTAWTRSYESGNWSVWTKHGITNGWSADGGMMLTRRSTTLSKVTVFAASSSGTLYHATGSPTNWTGLHQHGVADSWAH